MQKQSVTTAAQNKSDLESELSVIKYAMNSGSPGFYSYLTDLDPEYFSDGNYGLVFKTIQAIYEKETADSLSPEAVIAAARNSGFWNDVNKELFSEIVQSCKDSDVSISEVQISAKRIKYWHIIRKLSKKIRDAHSIVASAKGDEDVVDLISSVEESIFNFIPEIKRENDFTNISEFAIEHLDYVAKNPITMVGIPTGFPRYDECIGGGFRRGTVNVVGARPKVGKSTFCLNIAKNVSYANIPVLYLDTEMKKETQSIKWASLCSGVPQKDIETGAFGSNERHALMLKEAVKEFSTKPFYHISVAGMKPQEIFSVCRRWLSSVVGKNKDGSSKDCLIVLDYLKTMDLAELGDFQEYQYLGDFITKLHNFAVKNDVPVLATVQLNRDGINKEDTSVVSGSDRILWLCSSLAYLKKKTDEDIAAGDSKANGDRKMVVIETRYGKGMDSSSEYINIISNMDQSKFTEGKFNFEVLDQNNDNDVEDEDEFDF
jgi:replicative DNA helicase